MNLGQLLDLKFSTKSGWNVRSIDLIILFYTHKISTESFKFFPKYSTNVPNEIEGCKLDRESLGL